MAKVLCVCERQYAVAVKWNPAIFGKASKKVHVYLTKKPKVAQAIQKVLEKVNRKTYIDNKQLFSEIGIEMLLVPLNEVEKVSKETPVPEEMSKQADVPVSSLI